MPVNQVKALVDLFTDISGKIKDAKTRELLLPLREKIQEVREAQFEMEQKHGEELLELKEQHQTEIQQLNATIAEMAQASNALPRAEFSKETGTWVGDDDTHYCPRCWSEQKVSPMQDNGHGWTCGVCDKKCSDPKRRMNLAPTVINPPVNRRGPFRR